MIRICKANYQPHPIEEFNNNPFTEAISVIMDESEVSNALTYIPDTNIENLYGIYLSARINSLKKIHVPHPSSFNIYQKIVELILTGYENRNPLLADHTRLLYTIANKAKAKERFIPDALKVTTAPSSIASGPSGTGKTTTIRNVFRLIPQVIQHTHYQNTQFRFDQLVWISFDCPSTGSPKALALNFMKAVDNALGTDYHKEWSRKNKTSVDAHLTEVQLISAKHGLGFVHIDELQFMLDYGKHKDAPNLSTFEALFNKLGIPILLTCTNAGLTLFDSVDAECTTTRRMVSERDYRFTTHTLQSAYFELTFSSLFPKTLCVNNSTPSMQFKERFHYLSGGLPAIMNRLARLHHEYIIKNHHETTDDIDILNNIFKHQFGLIEPALQLLRQGKHALFEKAINQNGHKKDAWTNTERKEPAPEEPPEQETVPTINSQPFATSDHAIQDVRSLIEDQDIKTSTGLSV